jgi:hypothetical protein
VESTLGMTDDFLDVAVTPDHTTALVSTFHQNNLAEAKVTFVDLTTTPPTVKGSVTTPMFAEDVDISQDGRFAVVADGSLSPKVSSIDIASMTLKSTVILGFNAEGVTFVPNQPIVLVNGTEAGKVEILTIDANGVLTDTGVFVALAAPLNIQPSPDGAIALVPDLGTGVSILQIGGGGSVTPGGTVTPAAGQSLSSAQSIAFTPDGAHAYVLSTTGEVAVLNIDSAHNVTDSGTRITGLGNGVNYYGVDQIAVTGNGKYVVAHGAGMVSIIDPSSNVVLRTIPFANDDGVGGIASIR